MIQEFVDRFMLRKPDLEAEFSKNRPGEYLDLVKAVVNILKDDSYDGMDPERIHKIDDGHYQGTLLFVIASSDYQPSTYWYVKVYYGSCSGCDTLEAISMYDDGPVTPEQLKDYMTLALHIVQGLRRMDGEPS